MTFSHFPDIVQLERALRRFKLAGENTAAQTAGEFVFAGKPLRSNKAFPKFIAMIGVELDKRISTTAWFKLLHS